MTINARGLGNSQNANLFFDLIEKSGCDVCFVQETLVSNEKSITSLSQRWQGRSFWSPGIGRQGGVVSIISPKCNAEILQWKRDSHGRVVSILIRIDNVNLNLVNIYTPTNLTDCKDFYNSLDDFFLPGSGLIIGGNFNSYESALDKFGSNVTIHKDYDDLKASFCFVDAWRKLHPNVPEFTWFNADLTIGSRLDKFLISKDLFKSTSPCDISPCSLSDHKFVSFVFDVPGIQHRPHIWKLNNIHFPVLSLSTGRSYLHLIPA